MNILDHIPSKRKELHHPGIMEIHAPRSTAELLPSQSSQSSWTPPLSAGSTASSPSTLSSALMLSSQTHPLVLDENENENSNGDASRTTHRSKRPRDNYFSIEKDDHDMSIVIPENETEVVVISNSPSPSVILVEEGNGVELEEKDGEVQSGVDQEEARHYQPTDPSILQHIETDAETPAVAIESSRPKSGPSLNITLSDVQEVAKEAELSTPSSAKALDAALPKITPLTVGDNSEGAQKSIDTMNRKDSPATFVTRRPKKNDTDYDPKPERDVSIKTVVKPHDADVKVVAEIKPKAVDLPKNGDSFGPELPSATRSSRRSSSSLPTEVYSQPLTAFNQVLPRKAENRTDTNAVDKENKHVKDKVHYPVPDSSTDVRHRRISTAPSVISIQSEDSVYFVPKPSVTRKKTAKESSARTLSQAESQNAGSSRTATRRASTTTAAPEVVDIVGKRNSLSTRRPSYPGSGENPESAVCIQSEDDDDDVIVLDVRRPGPRAPEEYPLSDNFVRAPGVPRLRDFALPSLQRLSSRSASVIRKRSRQQSSRLGSMESQDDQTDTDRYGEDTIRLDDDVWEDQLDEWHPYAQGAIQLINPPEWIPNSERSQDSETRSRSFSFFTDKLTPPPPSSSASDAGEEEGRVVIMQSPPPRVSQSRARSPITFPGTGRLRSNRSSPVAVAPSPVPLILSRNGRATQPQARSEMKSLSPVQSPPSSHSQSSRPQRFGPLPLLIKR